MIFRRQTSLSPSPFPQLWQHLRHSSTLKCHLYNSELGWVGRGSIPSTPIPPQKDYQTGDARYLQITTLSPHRKNGSAETKSVFTILCPSNNPADSSGGQILVHLAYEDALSVWAYYRQGTTYGWQGALCIKAAWLRCQGGLRSSPHLANQARHPDDKLP